MGLGKDENKFIQNELNGHVLKIHLTWAVSITDILLKPHWLLDLKLISPVKMK